VSPRKPRLSQISGTGRLSAWALPPAEVGTEAVKLLGGEGRPGDGSYLHRGGRADTLDARQPREGMAGSHPRQMAEAVAVRIPLVWSGQMLLGHRLLGDSQGQDGTHRGRAPGNHFDLGHRPPGLAWVGEVEIRTWAEKDRPLCREGTPSLRWPSTGCQRSGPDQICLEADTNAQLGEVRFAWILPEGTTGRNDQLLYSNLHGAAEHPGSSNERVSAVVEMAISSSSMTGSAKSLLRDPF
jgi:hypothetical protein